MPAQAASSNPSLVPAAVSQRYGVDAAGAGPTAADRSGDADLPARMPLHERRAMMDSVSHLLLAVYCTASRTASSV